MFPVVISETSNPKIKEALQSIDTTLKRIEIILQNLQKIQLYRSKEFVEDDRKQEDQGK